MLVQDSEHGHYIEGSMVKCECKHEVTVKAGVGDDQPMQRWAGSL